MILKPETCSRCKRDMNKASCDGGCDCNKDHSNAGYVLPISTTPLPDNEIYNQDGIEYNPLLNKEIPIE